MFNQELIFSLRRTKLHIDFVDEDKKLAVVSVLQLQVVVDDTEILDRLESVGMLGVQHINQC